MTAVDARVVANALLDLADERIFVREVARGMEESVSIWLSREDDADLQGVIVFWRANGRMIQALEQAATHDRRLRRLWRSDRASGGTSGRRDPARSEGRADRSDGCDRDCAGAQPLHHDLSRRQLRRFVAQAEGEDSLCSGSRLARNAARSMPD